MGRPPLGTGWHVGEGGSATPTGRTGPVPAADRAVVAGASGDARLAVRRFVHLCVEVLNGYRPAAHLRRLSLPSQAADVVAQGVAGARRVAAVRTSRRSGARRALRPAPVAVLKLRLCEPRPGVVEAAVALVTGDRTWAMALRLELHQQTWCATVLRLI
nr:Rv3235 family protein [Actinoplanes rectilineatus]